MVLSSSIIEFPTDCSKTILNKPAPGPIKNDQAKADSKSNQVVGKHAFYWHYDTVANGHRQRIYDQPQTQWQRVKNSQLLAEQELAIVEERIIGINPADLTRQINLIQTQLTALARHKTQSAITKRQLDIACLVTINQSTKLN